LNNHALHLNLSINLNLILFVSHLPPDSH
jgi:hypothetical protein